MEQRSPEQRTAVCKCDRRDSQTSPAVWLCVANVKTAKSTACLTICGKRQDCQQRRLSDYMWQTSRLPTAPAVWLCVANDKTDDSAGCQTICGKRHDCRLHWLSDYVWQTSRLPTASTVWLCVVNVKTAYCTDCLTMCGKRQDCRQHPALRTTRHIHRTVRLPTDCRPWYQCRCGSSRTERSERRLTITITGTQWRQLCGHVSFLTSYISVRKSRAARLACWERVSDSADQQTVASKGWKSDLGSWSDMTDNGCSDAIML